MEYLCRFNIVGDQKEFEGKLVLDDNSFKLYLVETIPFNQQIINEGIYEEIKYHSEYWDRYRELFYSNNKIEGYIISNNRFLGDDTPIGGKKAFIIGSYRVSQSSTKQRVDYIFSFDSIIILSESIDAMPGYYNNVNTEEVLHDSIVSEISWNYDFEYQLNFFRRKNMGLEINTLKRHSQVIFRSFLQDAYKIHDDDFQFDPEIEKYDIPCFGNLNIDPWKLKKDQLNIGRLPLDCDVELSLKFDECIRIDEAFKRVKCIVYFFNFILSDFNFPSQLRFLQDNNLFEIKNNYNNTSEFSRSNRPIIDQRDIVNIDGLIKEWIHNYDSFFRIPFELYKNSHNINNSFEDRFRCIICTATGNLDHSLKQDCDTITIYLKGAFRWRNEEDTRLSLKQKSCLRHSVVKVHKQNSVGDITSANNSSRSGSSKSLKMWHLCLPPRISNPARRPSGSLNLSNLLAD